MWLPLAGGVVTFASVLVGLCGARGWAVWPFAAAGVIVVGGFGALLLAYRRAIVVDRASGAVSFTGSFWSRANHDVDIANVGAVQFCRWYRATPSKATLCEVNLVLRQPAGERINLVSEPDAETVRNDAQLLAEFLRVPLLGCAPSMEVTD
jgi:hypothetical protein